MNKNQLININKLVGGKGIIINNTLDFALNEHNKALKMLSLVRCCLADQCFEDKNRQTAFMICKYYDKAWNDLKLISRIKKIDLKNISNLEKIRVILDGARLK